ncbi:MAG: MOSC domain-containing protein [Pseudomonadota bacterium]
MISVTDLYRYPIKAYGVERLEASDLLVGACLPGDRLWAVLDARGKFDKSEPAWASCRNFARGAKSPELMSVTAKTAPDGRITLSHRSLDDITVDLTQQLDRDMFLAWAKPLTRDGQAEAVDVVSAPGVGFPDSAFQSVSIMARASLTAVSQAAGRQMSKARFRGNIWVDGTSPWEEFEWVGKRITVGTAELEVVEPITRCQATLANPETGQRDTNTLAILHDQFGHQEFGVNARVVTPGRVTGGDDLNVL